MEDNRNNTKTIMRDTIPNEKEHNVMTRPTDDEMLAAQGLLEFSQVIRKLSDNVKFANSIGTLNPSPPLVDNRREFSNFQRFPTYMSIADLHVVGYDPFGREAKPKPSPTYPRYSPCSVPIQLHRMAAGTSTRRKRRPTFPPLLPFVSPRLTLTSQADDEDTESIMIKTEEGKEDEEEVEEEKSKLTKKRKFYVNCVSKKREADLSYHRKKMDVQIKMEEYRSD